MNDITIHQPNEIATQREPTMLDIIREVASSPNADLGKLEKLLELQERVEARQAKTAYQKAMKACQEECPVVVRDAKNESNHSRYARLETVNQKIRPVIAKHGFSMTFSTGVPRDPKAVRIICRVLHEAGHWEEHEMEGDLDTQGAQGKSNKTSIQGLGSTVSYLRRYLTLLIFNVVIANEDNDGQKTGFITEQQAQAIVTLLAQCYTDPRDAPKVEAGFCSYMKVKTISEIHALDFQKSISILESKKRALAKQAEDIPSVEVLPDAVELVMGKRFKCKGKIYQVVDTEDGHRWSEVK